MSYILAFVFFLSILTTIFIPSDIFLNRFDEVKRRIKQLSVIYRGELLLEWLDNFGQGSYGHDLGERLPDKETYKTFGHHIHKIWNSVQKRGGELRGPLKAIRVAMRQDLKRTRREMSLLHSALGQVFFMLILVWCFLLALRFVAGLDLGVTYFILIGLWQGLGALFYIIWLNQFKRKFLSPLDELLKCLLEMHFLFYLGGLTEAYLQSAYDFKSRDRSLYSRMERTLEGWRKRGHGDIKQVDELFEDFSHLAEDKAENFVAKLKVSIFTWSVLFVLPPLFSSTLVGLGSMSEF